MLSIVSISALSTLTNAKAKTPKLLCLIPETTYVFNEQDEVYTIANPNDVFYADRIDTEFVYIKGTDLRVLVDDVVVGNDVVQYLRSSDVTAFANVCVDAAEIKPIDSRTVLAEVEKGTVFAVEDVSKYSVRVLYEEELCYLKRSNVHIEYKLHNLEIPEYGLCDTDEIIKRLDNAVAELDAVQAQMQQDMNTMDMVTYALTFVGNPYVWGGTDPNTGADCSGFVRYVYAKYGVALPRCSAEQCECGTQVTQSEAKPGDLLFFWKEARGGVGHVGMYIGNGQMVEAKGVAYGIVVSDVKWDSVYRINTYF